jgi:hypothetical protein
MEGSTRNSGFSPPKTEERLSRRQARAVELVATAALTVALVVAVTAVSITDRLLTRAQAPAAAHAVQTLPPQL